MAYFGEENISCECGSSQFEEVKLVVIKKEYSTVKNDSMAGITIPGRLLDSEEYIYKCTRCGKQLNI